MFSFSFAYLIYFSSFLEFIYAASSYNVSLNYYPDNNKSDDLNDLKLAISALKLKPFQQVTTIGSNCLSKFRVKSFLEKYDDRKNIENPNHLFDWMFCNNYTLFGEALRNDLNDSFGLDLLKVLPNCVGMGAVLYNEKYDFIFNHAFDGLKEISHNRGRTCLTKDNFAKYYHLIAEKITHLTENSKKAFFNSKRALYLGYTHRPEGLTQEDCINFLRAIKTKRSDNFLMLILVMENVAKTNDYEFDKILEGNLIFHKIKSYKNAEWHKPECINQWDEILKIALNNN